MLPTGERERGRRSSRAARLADIRRRLPRAAGAAPFVVAGGGRRIEVRSTHGYPYAQVYAPADDDVIAIEPMTAPTNALVAGGAELPIVEPGERVPGELLDHGERRRRVREAMRLAVVGHVEWVEFAVVERVPEPGEIVHVQEAWEEPAGGGAVAAVQLARLAGGCLFVTALGDDELGIAAKRDLEAMGVEVRAAWRAEPQRRAFVYLDASGERTITVIGERLTPRAEDPLPWPELERC